MSTNSPHAGQNFALVSTKSRQNSRSDKVGIYNVLTRRNKVPFKENFIITLNDTASGIIVIPWERTLDPLPIGYQSQG